jgi:hypothetical protein
MYIEFITNIIENVITFYVQTPSDIAINIKYEHLSNELQIVMFLHAQTEVYVQTANSCYVLTQIQYSKQGNVTCRQNPN